MASEESDPATTAREMAETIAGRLAGVLVNAFARGLPLVVTDGSKWSLDGQLIAKQIRPMVQGEIEDLEAHAQKAEAKVETLEEINRMNIGLERKIACDWHFQDKGTPGEPCGTCLSCRDDQVADLEAELERESSLFAETLERLERKVADLKRERDEIEESQRGIIRKLTLERTARQRAEEERGRLQVQLAGIFVALDGVKEGGENDAKEGNYGWSPAYEYAKKVRAQRDRLREALVAIRSQVKPGGWVMGIIEAALSEPSPGAGKTEEFCSCSCHNDIGGFPESSIGTCEDCDFKHAAAPPPEKGAGEDPE